jgi:hypothetical protein
MLRMGGRSILGVVLGGSFARNEATVFPDAMLSDLELFVVSDRFRLRLVNSLEEICSRYSSKLSVKISLAVVPYWAWVSRKVIVFYEAKEIGVFAYGDRAILTRGRFGPREIDAWESIRLLMNRGVELLASNPLQQEKTIDQLYPMVKAYLGCCEALLVLCGAYAPTYAQRFANFSDIFESSYPNLSSRFPELVKIVRVCTALKAQSSEEALDEFKVQKWVDARDVLLHVLSYCLNNHFGRNDILPHRIPEVLDTFRINRMHSVMSFFSYLSRGDFLPHLLLTEPVVQVWKAGIHLLLAVRNDYTIEEAHIERAAFDLARILRLSRPRADVRGQYECLRQKTLSRLREVPQLVTARSPISEGVMLFRGAPSRSTIT